MRFHELRAKAADDMSEVRGETTAAEQRGHNPTPLPAKRPDSWPDQVKAAGMIRHLHKVNFRSNTQ